MEDINARCLSCGGRLTIKRTCTQVSFRCRSCGADFPREKYKDLMDEDLEEQLANIPVNRL